MGEREVPDDAERKSQHVARGLQGRVSRKKLSRIKPQFQNFKIEILGL